MSAPSDDPARGDELSPAAEAFAAFLSMDQRGEAPDFDAFCAQHPGEAGALRRMHAQWRALEGAFGAEGGEPGVVPFVRRSPADRYRDPQRIGRGGMGEVQRVWDTDLGRWVARKVLAGEGDDPSTPSPSDPRTLGRFLAEAQVTARLEHPGIVPVHELGVDPDGRVFFTMAWIRGESLRELMPRIQGGVDGWSQTRALQVLLRVCEAVAFAHDRGVLHRDLKPSNVMVGRFGETYVVDWGLARVDDTDSEAEVQPPAGTPEPSADRTRHGDVVGTPAYMSPEQARGERDTVGAASDVYALGAILYELIAGHAPYADRGARTADGVVELVRAGPPTPVVTGSAAPELVAIQERAMARAPGERYPDVAALAEDLRAFLELRVVSAYRTGALVELRKWIARNRGVATAAAAALLAVVVGLVVAVAAQREADHQAERARTALATSLDSVERMLTRVGVEALAQVPRSGPIRRQLLEDALELHDGLRALDADDPELRSRAARARVQASVLANLIGDGVRARELQGAAIAELEQLLAERPDDPRRWAELCRAIETLAGQLAEAGQVDEGLRQITALVERIEPILSRFPDDRDLQLRVAAMHDSAAFVHQRAKDNEASLRSYERAFAIREALAAGGASDVELAARLVRSAVAVATGLSLVKRDDEAERAYVDASARLDALLAAHPDHPDVRREAAWAARSYAVFLIYTGRMEDARTVLAVAVERARARADELPSEPGRWTELAIPLQLTGRLQARAGEDEAALRSFGAALDAARVGYRAGPTFARHGEIYLRCAQELSNLATRLQRHELAASCAEELASIADGEIPPQRAAQILSRCVHIVRTHAELSDDRRRELADAYSARCIELLREALRRGFRDPDVFDRPEWGAMRDVPEVREVRRAAAAAREATGSK